MDINVKLDVYQHGDASVQKKISNGSADLPADVQLRRKNRMGEVQGLKNSRVVGENHLGLLDLREEPPGEYADYARKTLDAENRDRLLLMQEISRKGNVPLADVQRQQADLAAKRAFNGEWVEAAQLDGSFKWRKKGE